MRHLLPLLVLSACIIDDTPITPISPATPATPVTPLTPEGCLVDFLEPNDEIPAAGAGSYLGLTLDAADVDLFQLTLGPGEELFANALFDQFDGNLDLYITDANREILAFSISDTSNESAAFFNAEATPIDVWVETNLFEPFDDDCVPYDIEIGVTPALPPTPVCTDDASEPNDAPNTSSEILPVTDSLSTFDLVANDTDYFFLTAQPWETLDVRITHDAVGAALDVLATDALGELGGGIVNAGQELAFTMDGGLNGSTADLLIDAAPGTCAPYVIEVVSTLAFCTEDAYEPNDVTPSLVTPPVDIRMISGDVDRFDITLNPGEELQADIQFTHLFGNIDLALYNSTGALLTSSTTNTNDESVLWFNDSFFAQTITMELTLFNPQPDTCVDGVFDFVVFGATCPDDSLEGNDTLAGANDLLPQSGATVVYDLISDDDDWFRFSTLPGERIDMFLHHDVLGHDLEMSVYDAFGVVTERTNGPSVDAAFSLPQTSTGADYDLLIYPLTGPGVCLPYQLTVVSF